MSYLNCSLKDATHVKVNGEYYPISVFTQEFSTLNRGRQLSFSVCFPDWLDVSSTLEFYKEEKIEPFTKEMFISGVRPSIFTDVPNHFCGKKVKVTVEVDE